MGRWWDRAAQPSLVQESFSWAGKKAHGNLMQGDIMSTRVLLGNLSWIPQPTLRAERAWRQGEMNLLEMWSGARGQKNKKTKQSKTKQKNKREKTAQELLGPVVFPYWDEVKSPLLCSVLLHCYLVLYILLPQVLLWYTGGDRWSHWAGPAGLAQTFTVWSELDGPGRFSLSPLASHEEQNMPFRSICFIFRFKKKGLHQNIMIP